MGQLAFEYLFHKEKIMSNEAKCDCRHCGGHIAFPTEAAGQTVECPHCKLVTLLFIPSASTPPKRKNKTTALIVAIGFVFVAVAIGIFAFIGTVKNSKPSAPKINSKPSAPKPEENLQEVKGAMGWNLGDVLPTNFQVKTNDDGFGITYDFDPPADMEIALCYLILTEDRRIAVISLMNSENEHFNKDALQKVLKEKHTHPIAC